MSMNNIILTNTASKWKNALLICLNKTKIASFKVRISFLPGFISSCIFSKSLGN